jgi:hypothetical protein
MAKKVEKKIKSSAKVDQKRKEKKDNLLVWVIGVMIGLILVILLMYWYMGSMKYVSYEGLRFAREDQGVGIFYHYYYNFVNKAGGVTTYNLYIRNDPRELSSVPVNGEIVYPKGKNVYVAVNLTGIKECKFTSLSIGALSGFLSGNELNVRAASLDEQEAKQENMTFVNCTNKPDNVVMLIQQGSKTEINKQGNCYTINVANCEILQAIEKWEVQSIVDAKKAAEAEKAASAEDSLKWK